MNIGFISTRFSGTDGVSLESLKWAETWEKEGHSSFWFSGQSDRPDASSLVIPEAHFEHPENQWISDRIWNINKRDPYVSERIATTAQYLKARIRQFVAQFDIDILVPENALTIPLHVPLGIAITEYLAESGLKAIAHHHDFYWERIRFTHNAIPDLLDMAFPPRLPNLEHTVINSAAKEQLSLRKGVSSTVVPNVFKFEEAPVTVPEWSSDLRKEIGLSDDDIFILQPTRVVPRKGIEHAIQLVSNLDNPRVKLVISHDAGDEGYEYLDMLTSLAKRQKVDLILIGDRISESRGLDASGRKKYSLWDVYEHCDFVTYPSLIEGFGNAFLEAVYFKKPILVNRYPVYVQDILPKGFQLIEMDGFISDQTVAEVENLLNSPERIESMVEHNYEIALQHFGYESLSSIINPLIK